jgi:phospholipid/cholesterol/gamma-HCH transport system substrate-binding protein
LSGGWAKGQSETGPFLIASAGDVHVQCSGQQPDPCIYTPGSGPAAIYSPQSRDVIVSDGSRFALTNSTNTGDNEWKQMLAPAGQSSP